METFYIRHTRKMDVDQATLDYLWEYRKIAVHFPECRNATKPDEPDNASLNPEDYVRSGRSAMKVLAGMAQAGGYILGEYCHHRGCVIGVVESGTPIELYRGKWGKRSGREGREAVLKTLQLSKVQIVSEARSSKLLAGRPRQGTVMRWPSAGKMVENLIEGRATPLTVRDLTPTFQEVLCSEFLRLPTEVTGLPQLASLILPVGRTLRHLDIYGIDIEANPIVAQVTLQPSANCSWKVEALKGFNDPGVHRIFFCDDPCYRMADGIHYFPLREAYTKFVATPFGKRWLSEVGK